MEATMVGSYGRKESKMDKHSKMDLLDRDTIVCCNDVVSRFDLSGGRVV